MQRRRQIGKQTRERGAALLIAIFALLLISVVAIALIVSSGTDSALASNFRSSTNAYYAAVAGLEEARGRLLNTNGNCIPVPPNTVCNPQPALPMPLTQVVYIINPLGGETVAPWNTSNPSTYPDTEYLQEFGVDVSTRVVTPYASIAPLGGYAGPSYKWVRINPVTEWSLGGGSGNGVDVNWDGVIDQFTPLFYDPDNPKGNAGGGGVSPGLIVNSNPPATAGQALEITSYAVLPSGTQKMLQYVVRPSVYFPNLTATSAGGFTTLFPAALTLAGNNVMFTGPGTASFFVKGQDQCSGSNLTMPAIGYTNNNPSDTSFTNIKNGATPPGNYQGAFPPGPPPPPPPAPPTPSIVYVGNQLNPNWLTPSGLDAIVQNITNSADVVIQGNATGGSLPTGMSPTNPLTIVVNGDLDLNAWHNTGYGLLVVTGTLKYDPDASWQGVVLLIGQGSFVSTKAGLGEINGAVFIAKTRDASNNELPTLGAASYSQTGFGGSLGSGINLNSCVAQSAEGPIDYKIISFKEIPLS
jgi:hypothetical protein